MVHIFNIHAANAAFACYSLHTSIMCCVGSFPLQTHIDSLILSKPSFSALLIPFFIFLSRVGLHCVTAGRKTCFSPEWLLCPRFREGPVDSVHKRTGLLCNKTPVSSLLVQSFGEKTQIKGLNRCKYDPAPHLRDESLLNFYHQKGVREFWKIF